MIVSKDALQSVKTAIPDKQVQVLNNLHIEEDGTVVASNREGVVVVSPVLPMIRDKVPIKEMDSEGTCTLSVDTVNDIIKFIGVDKKYKGLLEHCDIVKKDKEGVITLYDGKRSKAIQAKLYPKDYYDYLSVVRGVYKKKTLARVVLNRKRLKSLLDTLEKVCSDSSDISPVYLEFTENNAMIMRGINGRTGQRVIAVCRGFKTDKWMEADPWEVRVSEQGNEPKKVVKQTDSKDTGGKYNGYVRKRR